jgi:hypothetical protein
MNTLIYQSFFNHPIDRLFCKVLHITISYNDLMEKSPHLLKDISFHKIHTVYGLFVIYQDLREYEQRTDV